MPSGILCGSSVAGSCNNESGEIPELGEVKFTITQGSTLPPISGLP